MTRTRPDAPVPMIRVSSLAPVLREIERRGFPTAALLLTLESVFGTLFSVAFYHEHLELRVIVGFALILVAILISETKLKFLRRRMA